MEREKMIREIVVTLASLPLKTQIECIEHFQNVANERAERYAKNANDCKELVQMLKRMSTSQIKEFEQTAALIMDGYATGYAAAKAETVAALQELDKKLDNALEIAKRLRAGEKKE